MSKSESFTPVTVTVETLQVLSKQPHYADLLALYMACVEITTWQKNNSIKASKGFMMERLHWGETKLLRTKKSLVKLGLLQNKTTKDNKGLITGHYVLVKHIVSTTHQTPGAGLDHALDFEGTSANDLQLSANNSKLSATKSGPNPPNKKEEAPGLKLFYLVVKKYGLPVINHNNLRKWAGQLGQMPDGAVYLQQLLDKDLRTVEGDFKPTLNDAFDILNKKVKIQRFYNGGEDKGALDPRVYGGKNGPR